MRKLFEIKMLMMGWKMPSPQQAVFSAGFFARPTISSDFSTTVPLVRGSFAMYIGASPSHKEVHDDRRHAQAFVRLGLLGR